MNRLNIEISDTEVELECQRRWPWWDNATAIGIRTRNRRRTQVKAELMSKQAKTNAAWTDMNKMTPADVNAERNRRALHAESLELIKHFRSTPADEILLSALAANITRLAEGATPAAQWRVNGEADPHNDRYDCERAETAMGYLSDDELANRAFLNFDVRPSLEALMNGTAHSPISWMTAVKDRIRWLSRKLVESDARVKALESQLKTEQQA